MKIPDSHTITVLGQKFQIKCPAGKEDELQAAANFLQQQAHDIYQNNSTADFTHITVLAALNISHALLSGTNKQAILQEKIRNVLATGEQIDV